MFIFYGNQSSNISKAFAKIDKQNHIAGIEIFTIVGGLQDNYIVSEEFYKLNRPLVFLEDKKNKEYEIIYENLERDTLNYIKKYICPVKMTKVNSVEEWIKNQNIKMGYFSKYNILDEGRDCNEY